MTLVYVTPHYEQPKHQPLEQWMHTVLIIIIIIIIISIIIIIIIILWEGLKKVVYEKPKVTNSYKPDNVQRSCQQGLIPWKYKSPNQVGVGNIAYPWDTL
jgi:ABC-type phosphate transport system permease subunit